MVKKRKKRDTYNYILRDGKKVVYKGITNDPDRRFDEHVKSGKRFTTMSWGSPCSREEAIKREKEGVAIYEGGHKGKKPRYNKR